MDHSFIETLKEGLGAVGAGVAGATSMRLVWVGYQLRRGDRKVMAAWLLFELFVALVMGLAAGGVAEWAGVTGLPVFSLAAAFGWLGPRGLEELIRRRLAIVEQQKDDGK